MSAWEVASANLQNMPSALMIAWPFILGNAAIEFVHSAARGSLLANRDDQSMTYQLLSSGLLGINDTAKLVYWNNYTVPMD